MPMPFSSMLLGIRAWRPSFCSHHPIMSTEVLYFSTIDYNPQMGNKRQPRRLKFLSIFIPSNLTHSYQYKFLGQP